MKRLAILAALTILAVHADAPAPPMMKFEFDVPKQQIRITRPDRPIAETDIDLKNTFTSEAIKPDQIKLSLEEQTGDVLVQFPAFPNGVLPDGTYLLIRGKETLEFFVLAGDINRDRKVDMLDFNILSGNFGVVAASYSNGDLNYDGTVDSKDLNIYQSQNGKSLPAPATQPATQPG